MLFEINLEFLKALVMLVHFCKSFVIVFMTFFEVWKAALLPILVSFSLFSFSWFDSDVVGVLGGGTEYSNMFSFKLHRVQMEQQQITGYCWYGMCCLCSHALFSLPSLLNLFLCPWKYLIDYLIYNCRWHLEWESTSPMVCQFILCCFCTIYFPCFVNIFTFFMKASQSCFYKLHVLL